MAVIKLLLTFIFLGQSHGALKLASYYSDHMVLQRGPQHAVLWGTADTEGDTVTAQVTSQGSASTMVQNGKWKLKLPAITDPGPFVIDVISSDGNVTLRDVLFGDVWVCSGQSNMQFAMSEVMNASAEIQTGLTFKTIRFMQARMVTSDTLLDDLPVGQQWTAPTAASLRNFSAVCFLFAEYLQPHLNYPLGLVGTYWGGSTIEAWSPPEATQRCPAVQHVFMTWCPQEPQVLWNSMMAPLLPMTITGFLWYQGESNVDHPSEYACQTKATLAEWRAQFHRQSLGETSATFPFGYVQLSAMPNMSYSAFIPALRWAQTYNHGYSPNADLPDSFMAVAMDLSDIYSYYGPIHPRYKQQVAERLVLGALNVAYGQNDVQFLGPFPASFHKDSTGRNLTIQYDPTTFSQLQIRRNVGFDVCCNQYLTCDRTYSWGYAPIIAHDRSHVTIDVSRCGARDHMSSVRYAWRLAPCPREQCAVYDAVSGLPAPPFLLEIFEDQIID